MSLSVSNINPTSFKGIVKVNLVFDGDKQTTDKAIVDSATKQLKAILMKKDPDSKKLQELLKKNNFDKQKTLTELDENLKRRLTNKSIFRQIYNFFDKDYKIPEKAPIDDAGDIFTKVRTGKYGNEVYLASGKDALDVYSDGKNIGSKKALERCDAKHTGVAQQAKETYFSMKDEIAARYTKDPLQPSIYLYTQKDKKGIVRLVGARMENSQNLVNARNPFTQTVILNPQYQKALQTQQQPSVPQQQPKSSKKEKPVQMQGLADGIPWEDKEKNPTLEELSHKKWDSVTNTPKKKTHRKKKTENPNQMNFFDKLG